MGPVTCRVESFGRILVENAAPEVCFGNKDELLADMICGLTYSAVSAVTNNLSR
jgi:hypothetical protein